MTFAITSVSMKWISSIGGIDFAAAMAANAATPSALTAIAERNVRPRTKYTATTASSRRGKTRGSPPAMAEMLTQDIATRAAVMAMAM